MTLTELEHAQKAMQQQWYDLVIAEQQGSSLEVLEQMYDSYILLAEEYNRCREAFQHENREELKAAASFKKKNSKINLSSEDDEGLIKLAS